MYLLASLQCYSDDAKNCGMNDGMMHQLIVLYIYIVVQGINDRVGPFAQPQLPEYGPHL